MKFIFGKFWNSWIRIYCVEVEVFYIILWWLFVNGNVSWMVHGFLYTYRLFYTRTVWICLGVKIIRWNVAHLSPVMLYSFVTMTWGFRSGGNGALPNEKWRSMVVFRLPYFYSTNIDAPVVSLLLVDIEMRGVAERIVFIVCVFWISLGQGDTEQKNEIFCSKII